MANKAKFVWLGEPIYVNKLLQEQAYIWWNYKVDTTKLKKGKEDHKFRGTRQ